MERAKIFKVAGQLNFIPRVPRIIYDHLVDESHTLRHRVICGLIIGLSGVIVSKLGTGYVHYITDLVGYCIHGLGSVPLIDYFIKKPK